MDPYSRGKRLLDLSLQKSSCESKRSKLCKSPDNPESRNPAEAPSILNISTSQLVELPEELDLSIASNDISFSDLPPLSSAIKVANYIMHQCSDKPHNTLSGSTGGMSNKVNIERSGEVLAIDGAEIVESVNVDEFGGAEEVLKDANIKQSEDAIEFERCVNIEIGGVNERMQDVNVETGGVNERMQDVNVETGAEDLSERVETVNVESRADVENGNSRVLGASKNAELQVHKNAGGIAGCSSSQGRVVINLTKKEEQKRRRQFGKTYIGRHFDKDANKFVEVNKEEKKMGSRCTCKASYYSCKEVCDSDRERIHKEVWNMSWDEKKVFVRMAVDVKDVKERKSASDVPRRNNTLFFYLKCEGTRVRVCKDMFLSTTGLKKWWVLNTLTEDVSSKTEDLQGTHQVSGGLNFVKEFLGRLPKMPSHYCRKDTKKMYLEPSFQSYADIYREYLKVCETEGKEKMSRTVFVAEVKASGISIFVPRKDQCDTCCEFAQGNIEEGIYNRHRERKEAAQEEKKKDKDENPLPSRTKVLCVDVQRVLLSPSLKASALYYKTKLQVHNYIVFDMASKDVVCYLWNEVEGGLNASEFASCLVSYLEDSRESFDKAVIYSDGCTYQNRNWVLATTLRYFCVKHGKTVEQKILERGHTQMEVDSVHATIERRLKNMDIYSPLDYVNLIKVARSSPSPYKVKYLTFDFFKDFDKYGEGSLHSIKPSKTDNVTSICALQYLSDGSLSFKLNFCDEWQGLPLGRRDQISTADPHRLYKSKRKIKKSKFDHLQTLKSVLPADVHHFYNTLPHQ